MTTKTYEFTYLAGPWVAGRRRGTELTIDLTDAEAEYDLRNGTIVLAGTPTTPPTPLPPVLPTDLIERLRNGSSKDVQVSDLVLYLLGTSQSPGPVRSAINDLLQRIDITGVAGLQAALAGKATPADLTALRTGLLNGADAAHDTFAEIQALLVAEDGAMAAALTAIGNRLIADSNLGDLPDKAAALATINGMDRRILALAANPVPSDIPDGTVRIAKNQTTGRYSLWVNDGGTIIDLLTFTTA